uniref:Uncharacterized protein n=1 Tax=Arundo donax TaxID=35708 RepID=A0A0A9H1F0_ARUDO
MVWHLYSVVLYCLLSCMVIKCYVPLSGISVANLLLFYLVALLI